MLYEQGNELEGLNIYLEGNTLYAGVWQESTNQRTWLSTNLESAMHTEGMHDMEEGMHGMGMEHTHHGSASPWRHVVISLDATEANSSQGFRAYLDGLAFPAMNMLALLSAYLIILLPLSAPFKMELNSMMGN